MGTKAVGWCLAHPEDLVVDTYCYLPCHHHHHHYHYCHHHLYHHHQCWSSSILLFLLFVGLLPPGEGGDIGAMPGGTHLISVSRII